MISESNGNIPTAGAESPGAASAPAWFCIRSHLKHEHIAAAHLAQIPDVEAFSPRLRVLRPTRRGPVWSTEPLFPNYLFARFVLEAKLEKVRYTPAVAGVLHFGGTVPPIRDTVIDELRRDLEKLKSEVLTEAPEEGEEVEVAGGAFKGLTGSVARVLPGRQRVQILLDFMGRSVAAELSLEQLLFRRREAASLVLQEAKTLSTRGPRIRGPTRALSVPLPAGSGAATQGIAGQSRAEAVTITSDSYQ